MADRQPIDDWWRHGQIIIPFGDRQVLPVYRDEDGNYLTTNPLLRGPFDELEDVCRAATQLFRNRILPPVVTQDGPPNRRRRAGQRSSLVLGQCGPPNRPRGTRLLEQYGRPTRPRTTGRAPSPVETRDLQPPPPPSEKLVADVAESASALTLQEPDASSSALNTASLEEWSPRKVLHSTTDGSSSSSPFRSDKLVASAAESASAQTLQKSDDSSSEELLDITSSDESITASPRTLPHNTIDGSPPSGHCYSVSSGPTIWFRSPCGWYFVFYIRMDRGGSFHMYPSDLGGPFLSLKEVEDAIGLHLDRLQCAATCNEQDELPPVERLIRRILFYPDGTPKRGPNSPARKNPNYRERHLVQAVLDQYNDDHNLFGDRAHLLNGDVRFQWIDEETRCYYHFNFMTKTKEAGDVYHGTGNLFFAEVSEMQRDGDWVVSCCRIIEPNNNGLCYGCIRNGSPNMKHPNNTDAYTGGHVDRYLTFGGDPISDSDDDEETQMAKLRIHFKDRDGPGVWEKIEYWNRATVVQE